MSTILNFIEWNVEPAIFSLAGREIRYYGLLFALSFLLGIKLMEKIFSKEGVEHKKLDKLFVAVMIGTVVGARLGHVFFYDWVEYKDDLWSIFKVWEGGLASHGAVIGIFLSLVWYERKILPGKMMWVLDRVVLPIALACFFIRLGNLFNHEILGVQTDVAWAFLFKYGGDNPVVPRHPAQLYESLLYLIVFATLYKAYWSWDWKANKGKMFGFFMMALFSIRFFIEFFKEKQTDSEANLLGDSLNMGHLLSIPLILVGLYFFIKSKKDENLVA